MIEKIQRIEKFAVFKSFDWDSCVCDQDGKCLTFKKLNIIYGRNYSGKTTLSRVARALENGIVDEKFGGPSFSVQFAGNVIVDQSGPCSHGRTIRVFNEDFVKENLRFISNPEDDVNAFAILGKDNNKLEAEIQTLEDELGVETAGAETGLYSKLVLAKANLKSTRDAAERAEKTLAEVLTNKATKGPSSIKYQSDQYGDQNYNITKIKKDVDTVTKPGFEAASREKQTALKALLKEESRLDVVAQVCPEINLTSLIEEVTSVVTREISRSSKIDELIRDATLNRWASEGRRLHAQEHADCKFCGNAISIVRWAAIESHFDSESDKLELDISKLEGEVRATQKLIDARERFDESIFYSQFQAQVKDVERRAAKAIRSCRTILDELLKALEDRKKNTLSVLEAPVVVDSSHELVVCHDDYEKLRLESNGLSSTLKKDQEAARDTLRLAAIHDFVETIDYVKQKEKIAKLNRDADSARTANSKITKTISDMKQLIADKRRQLNDEEQGAIRVNDLLNGFFGNRYLSLQASEKDGEAGQKHVRFEVVRNGEKAYHLSEGERSLLAFCYFMAKLDEVDTAGAKPIVWIDDPISSLDGNHIFFVYSLINNHLFQTINCEQVFISTHNLDFLKYLHRLPGKRRYLIVERRHDSSNLKLMPDYMAKHVTEFNYLFEQIYQCAVATEITDENYRSFYGFGNNARKFLELYLYYAYPDDTSDEKKLKRFFGDLEIPAILSDRINNEYSHMAGVFERGSTPIVQPEMQLCAKAICDRLAQNPDQYRALLRSIGREDDLDAPDSLGLAIAVAAE